MGSSGGRRRSPGAQKRHYQKSVLIVCEGKNTEPIYFKALVNALRLDMTIEVKVFGDTAHTDPAGLLEDTSKLREQRDREAKHSNVLRPYDEVWIVFDTEWPGKHTNLPQSTRNVLNKGFRPAISNPSFEVWFLLHDRPTPPGCGRCQDAVAVLKRVHNDLCHYGKNREATQKCVDWSLAEARLPQALKHGHAQPPDSFSSQEPHLPTATATSVHLLVGVLVDACDDEPARQRLGFTRASS